MPRPEADRPDSATSAQQPSPAPTYREWLYAPKGAWAVVIGFAILFSAQLHPALLGTSVWLIYGVPLAIGIAGLLLVNRGRVSVIGDVVRAGGNSFDVREVASVEELDVPNTRRAIGPEGDPSAWAFTRPWIHTSVRVVSTTDDPPYFLISSRRPTELAAAIVAAAEAHSD